MTADCMPADVNKRRAEAAMSERHRPPGKGERIASVAVVLTLALVAAGVGWRHVRTRGDQFRGQSLQSATAPKGDPTDTGGGLGLGEFIPEGFAPFGAPERFGPETLFEKIDGRAELYLPAGFEQLTCQRFAATGKRDPWAGAFVYRMDSHEAAFSVYSGQRRSGAEPIDAGRFAYGTSNAVFFVHGPYYVELIGSEPDSRLVDAMVAFARGFIGAVPVERQTLAELELLPAQGRQPGSTVLLLDGAFGFEGFDTVLRGRYETSDGVATGYVSLCDSPEAARSTASAYERFLISLGGVRIGNVPGIPEARVIRLLDMYESIFTVGEVLAGVHEAPNRETADEVASRIWRHLTARQ